MKAKFFFLAFVSILFSAYVFAQRDSSGQMNQRPNRTGADSTRSYRSNRAQRDSSGRMNQGTNRRTRRDSTSSYRNNRMDHESYQTWKGDSMHRHSGFGMRNGKMMIMQNGKAVAMMHDTTLSNGVKIMTDGTVVMKNGEKKVLKEGEHVDKSGKIIRMENGGMRRDSTSSETRMRGTSNEKHKAYMVPDSAKNRYEKK